MKRLIFAFFCLFLTACGVQQGLTLNPPLHKAGFTFLFEREDFRIYFEQATITALASHPQVRYVEQIINRKRTESGDLSRIKRSERFFLLYDCANHTLRTLGYQAHHAFWGSGLVLFKDNRPDAPAAAMLSPQYQQQFERHLCGQG